MKIGLLNWDFHNNLGDSAMATCIKRTLESRGHEVVNQGESYVDVGADAYFWGGGTLISGGGVFPPLPEDVPVIGFGIGVAENPPSVFREYDFHSVKHIFARDYYSYMELCKHGIPTTLSFDPVFLLEPPQLDKDRTYVAVNIIASGKTDYSYVRELLLKYKDEDIRGFSVGLPEDPAGCVDFDIPCTHFTDPIKLLAFLSEARACVTTRLHATVFAYMAGVPVIDPVIYDPKVKRFMEYVVENKLDHAFMRERLNEHIDYALSML